MQGVTDPGIAAAVAAYVKLMRARSAVVARVEPMLAKAGLTLTQLGVLEALLHKGPMCQRDLVRKILTSPGNMTDVIDKLQRRGLVARAPMPGDRRQVQVNLTDAGRELISTVFPHHAQDIAGAMSGLDGGEIAQLNHLLRKLGMAAAQAAPVPCKGDPAP